MPSSSFAAVPTSCRSLILVEMGNHQHASSRSVQRRAESEMRSLEKLVIDVRAAKTLLLEVREELACLVEPTLLTRTKISPALLPIVWRFGRNSLIRMNVSDTDSNEEDRNGNTDQGYSREEHFLRPIEFYRLYVLLRDLAEAKSATASDNVNSVEINESDECCLCMDAAVNVVLPCAHGFCEDCLSDWTQQSSDGQQDSTCPMCRRALREASDELWTLGDTNDMRADASSARCRFLAGQVMQAITRRRQSTSQSSTAESAPAESTPTESTTTTTEDSIDFTYDGVEDPSSLSEEEQLRYILSRSMIDQ